MIRLLRLASFNLAATYARAMGDNKIRHYFVSYSKILIESKIPDELVIEYIKKETGDASVVIETPKVNNSYGIGPEAVQLAKDVLENLPKIEKMLKKREIKSTLYEYNKQDAWYKYLLNPIAISCNWIVNKINAKWENYQWEKLGGYPKSKLGNDGLLALRHNIKSIPLLPIASWRRYITPCHYLSVTFDESSRNKAVEILQNDLKILADNKLIMGHMAMPFQIQLADTVGSGELSYVLACFLFVNDFSIEKLVGSDKYDEFRFKHYSKLQLNSLLGLKTEAQEGALSNVDLRKKYTIEEVNIFEGERQADWDAYVKSYEEQQDAIKKNNEIRVKNEKARHEEYKAQLEAKQGQLPNPIDADAPTLISDKKD